ncbi:MULTISPECIES: HipA domain-containing protein [Rhizobium]|uniref:HipA family protein n=3 Tax=Rhizobium TaxID=379 RepID=A0A0B4X6B6_9HYPH|nr:MULTISPECIES: HipA domain-containing protein [Rhizobium]AJD43634.1 HipA family protein [Rhizobium gallicum bv. gallicum R602sp]MBB4276467.1 serine/threonine-protein kinase HipA [Rhizobium mongolense]TCU33082.1 serine/threonine-protein kinase HipA [Rhizobium azibense]TDW34129.1 serine/threonine-protein kinase HipA [Rhizobium azibense]
MDIIALDVRLDGFDNPIGNLVRDEAGALAFAYSSTYLETPDAIPLSLSLPLEEEAYEDNDARPFFDNLLQERDGPLQKVLDREGLARSDVAGLLFYLGRDCPGALSVLPLGSPAAKVPGNFKTDYRRLDEAQLIKIVHSLHRRQRLPDETEDPSPLAGVQSKIALTILPDGTFAEPLPGSGAPTTHIVKVPDRAHPNDPDLELEALRLSATLGFETAEATVRDFEGVSALIIRRFDRSLDQDNRVIRIHQEDFAQALGLPPSLKYERNGTVDRRFDAEAINSVLNATNDPAAEKQTFIAATLFDLMTGNVDAHAKNFALLYEPGGGVRVAPRYDLMPTRLDPDLTDLLPYAIGEATKLTEITEEDFSVFLRALGIVSERAQRRLRLGLTGQVSGSLIGELRRMDRSGMKRFADLIGHNIDELLTAFGLPVPDQIRERDAYLDRGGGWLLGS